jgi:hypothetical protein
VVFLTAFVGEIVFRVECFKVFIKLVLECLIKQIKEK